MYRVNLKIAVGILLILGCGVSFAQRGAGPEKSALKNMEKHRWEKAEIKLRKILHKDTVNASVRYILSSFYFSFANPAFSLDSAYHYALTALKDFQVTPARERERLRRFPLDSLTLITVREKIDSAAFEQARNINTEAGYLLFLSQYASATQRQLATELRDEVAYQDAVKVNTHQAFASYLHRYPGASRAAEAKTHYERLLYQAETSDMRLDSFEKFLAAHPDTPYGNEIYRHIFELMTAGGTVDGFLKFINRYPVSDLVKRARQIIFHILTEEENPQWPEAFLNDSLQNLRAIQNTYLVPVLKKGLYGFMNENGQEIIRPEFETIAPGYLCGNITEEVLVLDKKLVARNGSVVYNGAVQEVSELGIGFLKIKTPDGIKLIHKAGFVFSENIQDARVLSKRFVALEKDSVWRLFTLAGRQLGKDDWDDINAFRDVLVFKKNARYFIAPISQFGSIADGRGLQLSEPYDEVRTWPYDLIWVKTGEFQGVLNQSLQPVMRFDKHSITRTFFGASAVVPKGINLYNWAGQEASTFEEVKIYGPWVAVKKRQWWYLFEPYLQEIESPSYDSIKAEGPFVIGLDGERVVVHFARNKKREFLEPLQITFLPGMDSTSFLVVEDKEHLKSVFDLKGNKLFSTAFDRIEYAGQQIFVITRKEKKGLINRSGDLLLPAEYDAIGSIKDNVLSVLKNKRFGCYHALLGKLIKPQYDRNLTPYAGSVLVTFKDGYYGFLGWDNKPLSPFEFDEIKYWDDSLALVKKGALWNFYNIVAKEITQKDLQNITMIKNLPDEKIAIIEKDNAYGVISSARGVVIPPSFTDIINLGSTDNPMYFTEKNIREASLFIIIYYDRLGKMLRKEIYEDAADYDKIYCSDN